MTASTDLNWHFACARSEMPPGGLREVTLPGGKIVLLIATEDGVFACCADCPHQETPLIEGHVEGTVLTCPVHFWQWDLKTGAPMGVAELPLPLYPVEERDGDLFIGFAATGS